MMSPDAIASLIVTKEGDTFDCRQWQRVIAQPGKLMNRDSEIYNVTASWTSILSSARATRSPTIG